MSWAQFCALEGPVLAMAAKSVTRRGDKKFDHWEVGDLLQWKDHYTPFHGKVEGLPSCYNCQKVRWEQGKLLLAQVLFVKEGQFSCQVEAGWEVLLPQFVPVELLVDEGGGSSIHSMNSWRSQQWMLGNSGSGKNTPPSLQKWWRGTSTAQQPLWDRP